jgi:methionine synthase I (cobalamin-dependent)
MRIQCVHPKNLLLGLNMEENKTLIVKDRLKGIQANTSILSPEELNNSMILKEDDFDELINGLNELRINFGFNILGGCCGTNKMHIDALANNITHIPALIINRQIEN